MAMQIMRWLSAARLPVRLLHGDDGISVWVRLPRRHPLYGVTDTDVYDAIDSLQEWELCPNKPLFMPHRHTQSTTGALATHGMLDMFCVGFEADASLGVPSAMFSAERLARALVGITSTEQVPVMASVLDIDAVKHYDGWEWNSWYRHSQVAWLPGDKRWHSARALLKWLRTEGMLSEGAKGKVRVDFGHDIMDGYLITVMDKGTMRPLFALSTFH